jgi:hypothetical protein
MTEEMADDRKKPDLLRVAAVLLTLVAVIGFFFTLLHKPGFSPETESVVVTAEVSEEDETQTPMEQFIAVRSQASNLGSFICTHPETKETFFTDRPDAGLLLEKGTKTPLPEGGEAIAWDGASCKLWVLTDEVLSEEEIDNLRVRAETDLNLPPAHPNALQRYRVGVVVLSTSGLPHSVSFDGSYVIGRTLVSVDGEGQVRPNYGLDTDSPAVLLSASELLTQAGYFTDDELRLLAVDEEVVLLSAELLKQIAT